MSTTPEELPLSVQIDPDAVNKYIASKILESAIGEELNKAINETLKGLSSYNNPYEKIVARHVEQEIEKLIQTEYSEQIKKVVQQNITDKFTEDMITKLFEAWRDKFRKGY